jgi:hypothetical protein
MKRATNYVNELVAKGVFVVDEDNVCGGSGYKVVEGFILRWALSSIDTFDIATVEVTPFYVVFIGEDVEDNILIDEREEFNRSEFTVYEAVNM